MYRFATDELGEHRGRRYFLTVAVEPDPRERDDFEPYRDAEDWCVTIHYPAARPNESDTEVVRIDTRHGRPHIDKLFLPERSKEWLPARYDLAAAERRLASRWLYYAERYDRYHGEASEE